MVQASSYGDNFRIQIQQKPIEDKSKSSKSVNLAVSPDVKDADELNKSNDDAKKSPEERKSSIDECLKSQGQVKSNNRSKNYFPEIYKLTTVQ